MNLHFSDAPAETVSADALAVLCFEKPEPESFTGPAAQSSPTPDAKIAGQSGWLAELRSTGEFTGKLYEFAILHRPEGLAARRLVVIGAGKREKFSPGVARRIAAAAARSLCAKGVRHLAVMVEDADAQTVRALAEGAVLGSWEPHKYKTDPKKNSNLIETFTVVAPGGAANQLAHALETGRILAEAQNMARDLVNEPGNHLLPSDLVAAAEEMCAAYGLHCEVLDRDRMKELGMGALLGVAQGSTNPPFLIVMRYAPSRTSGEDHLALVGKGVTFDTGGISIKPADNMEKMKYDMAGAAAVIGAMRAIAQLKPAVPVTGYIPTVENMLSGDAQRPGDIVTTLSGKTVEVINTDAEGRLILADAITYANRNGATHMIDAATLTGAITVALGHHNIGAFTNSDEMLGRVKEAATRAGEKVWQLPLEEEYKDYLKSAFADLGNVGGRAAGSITAAWFLKEFADPTPWVHLDIASTAWQEDTKPWIAKGPTGVAVRLFTELAIGWQETSASSIR